MANYEYVERFQNMCKHVEETAKTWKAKWPNHCPSCLGNGLHQYQESHGFTHGPSETITDPCSCTEEGKCPRCGTEHALNDEGEGPCKECGWNYDGACPSL